MRKILASSRLIAVYLFVAIALGIEKGIATVFMAHLLTVGVMLLPALFYFVVAAFWGSFK